MLWVHAVLFALHFAVSLVVSVRWALIWLASGVMVPWLIYLAIAVSALTDADATPQGDWAIYAGVWMVGVAGSLTWLLAGGIGAAAALAIRGIVGLLGGKGAKAS